MKKMASYLLGYIILWAQKKKRVGRSVGGKKKRPHKKKDEGAKKKKCGRNCGGKKVDGNRPHLFFKSCGRFLIFFYQSLGRKSQQNSNL